MTHAIECEGVWKIFGARAAATLDAIRRENLGKDEVLQRFDCVVAVADATFAVEVGEVFCVMGLSGSGKSTLLRHINRLIEPTEGEIRIHGEDIGRKSAEQLRQIRSEKIGMVFQNMALLPHRTVIDNVAFGLELRGVGEEQRRAVAEQKLDTMQLEGWGERFPDELSGGMRQRVGLARALAGDPDILLMDEPFSALDPLIRRQLQDQFLELKELMRKTTVFITHDLDEAIRLGDRIAIMKDGKLVQIATPEVIVTQPADDYVADFVQGISRLKLACARSVMEPVDRYRGGNEDQLAHWPTASETANLDELIALSVRTDDPIVVVDSERQPIGVVNKRALLRGIQGGGEHD